MSDPRKLFRQERSKLITQVLYYTKNSIQKIDSRQIGGLNSQDPDPKEAVRNICSIKLRFRDGSPPYRVIVNPRKKVRVMNIVTKDENGKKWVTHWSEARENESEYWEFREGI
jgi:hypothetical protein